MSKLTIPTGLQRKELLKFVVENKHILIEEKKSVIKQADCIMNASGYSVSREGSIIKSVNGSKSTEDSDTGEVSVVINTTNWLDSHGDVHMNGIWKRSLNNNSNFLLLQEHQLKFDHIISDKATAFTKKFDWKAMGQNFEGKTEALIFESPIERKRNSFMFNQYKEGWVKNHSVGMRYLNIDIAVNMDDDDEDARYYKEEIAVWKEVYPLIANKEDADNTNYIWVVREAKIVEGSAVPIGSNIVTPTLEVKFDSTTHPKISTEYSQKEAYDWRAEINKTQFLKF